MTSTPTAGLGVRKQSLGANRNVWGDSYLNDNLDLIDQALTGVGTATLSGTNTVVTVQGTSTTTGTTLPRTQYEASPFANRALVLAGTPSAGFVLTLPGYRNRWTVRNDCAEAVAVVTAAGTTTATIPAGARCDLVSDGTTPAVDAPTYFGGRRLTGLAVGTATDDAATKGYVDTFTADRSAGGYRLTNLAAGTATGDAATVAQIGIAGALPFAFSTSTTDADPGAGTLRLNAATQSSATKLIIDDADGNGTDVSAFVLSWDDSTSTTKGHIVIRSRTDNAKFLQFAITGLTDNAGWTTVDVTHVTGSAASPFADGAAVLVAFTRVGDKGETGPTGGIVGGTLTGDIDGDDAYTLTSLRAPAADGDALSRGAGDGRYLRQGVHSIWIPAAAMKARTTNGSAAGTAETSTNKIMLATLDFDAGTAEYAQFNIRMPKSWDEGTVSAAFVWSHASTTTNFDVVWGIQGVALSDGDAADTAFGTAQTVTDTGGTTDDVYQSAATSGVTIGGTPAAEDWVVFQVYRNATSGSDTLAVDARLHGVLLIVTYDAANDA